jgi:hypothetical protein
LIAWDAGEVETRTSIRESYTFVEKGIASYKHVAS